MAALMTAAATAGGGWSPHGVDAEDAAGSGSDLAASDEEGDSGAGSSSRDSGGGGKRPRLDHAGAVDSARPASESVWDDAAPASGAATSDVPATEIRASAPAVAPRSARPLRAVRLPQPEGGGGPPMGGLHGLAIPPASQTIAGALWDAAAQAGSAGSGAGMVTRHAHLRRGPPEADSTTAAMRRQSSAVGAKRKRALAAAAASRGDVDTVAPDSSDVPVGASVGWPQPGDTPPGAPWSASDHANANAAYWQMYTRAVAASTAAAAAAGAGGVPGGAAGYPAHVYPGGGPWLPWATQPYPMHAGMHGPALAMGFMYAQAAAAAGGFAAADPTPLAGALERRPVESGAGGSVGDGGGGGGGGDRALCRVAPSPATAPMDSHTIRTQSGSPRSEAGPRAQGSPRGIAASTELVVEPIAREQPRSAAGGDLVTVQLAQGDRVAPQPPVQQFNAVGPPTQPPALVAPGSPTFPGGAPQVPHAAFPHFLPYAHMAFMHGGPGGGVFAPAGPYGYPGFVPMTVPYGMHPSPVVGGHMFVPMQHGGAASPGVAAFAAPQAGPAGVDWRGPPQPPHVAPLALPPAALQVPRGAAGDAPASGADVAVAMPIPGTGT
jgi:hypothetical protein